MATPEQQPRGRSRRKIRLSTKAQEAHAAGELIPGVARPTSASSPPSPHAILQFGLLPVSSPLRAQDALRLVKRCVSGATMPPHQKQVAPLPHRRYHQPTETWIPSFKALDLAIYFWPCPMPTDFTRLTPAQKRWKDRTDQPGSDPLLFPDSDLADDWGNFAGHHYYNSSGQISSTREFAIASTFVARAKRAYVAGKPWEQFVIEEEGIDSMQAAVDKEPDHGKLKQVMCEALDNSLRLAVFDQLKPRLCTEIWSLPYRPRGPASVEAAVKAEKTKKQLLFETERTVDRWETRAGWDGELHPVPVFKEDLD